MICGDRKIADRVRLASTVLSRAIGLIGRSRLDAGEGLWITPCSSIHTFFMAFPIDVVFADAEGRVSRVWPRLRPWRMAWGGWSARHALELAAGAAEKASIRPGERIGLADDVSNGEKG